MTICVEQRHSLFGRIVDGEMQLGAAGEMITLNWHALPNRFPDLILDAFVVMPNHVHGILILPETAAGSFYVGAHGYACGTLRGSLGRIIQAFKSITTTEYIVGVTHHGWPPFPGKLWQRNYWERVIRDEDECNRAREYICNNPSQWMFDALNQNPPS